MSEYLEKTIIDSVTIPITFPLCKKINLKLCTKKFSFVRRKSSHNIQAITQYSIAHNSELRHKFVHS